MNLFLELAARPDGTRHTVQFVVAIIVITYVCVQSRRRNHERKEALTWVAALHEGSVLTGGIFSHPRLSIRLMDAPAEVRFDSGDRFKSKWTKLQAQWSSPVRLRVAPRSFRKWVRSVFGGRSLELGDRAFDEKFWVEASDPDWVRAVLSPRIRLGLMGFREDYTAVFSKPITLDLGPGGLTMRAQRPLIDEPELLNWFLQLAGAILAAAQERTGVAGIEITGVEFLDGASCPVCGTAVERGPRCRTCGTSHHDDCWSYSGGCAVFACRGRMREAV